MLAFIVRSSLRYPVVAILLAAAALALGTLQVWHAQVDVFPEFVPNQAEIQTEAPGLTAEQVETLVTQPLENALAGTPHVATVRSASTPGLSAIQVVFDDTVDPYAARQQLTQRLAQAAGSLPPEIPHPALGAMTSSTMDLLKVGFVSDRLGPMDLRSLVEWTVKPRLLGLPGVARALVFGGETRELEVRVKADALATYGVSLADVAAAVRSATGVRGAGFVDTPNQRIALAMDGSLDAPQEWAKAVAVPAADGRSLSLGDLAEVGFRAAPRFGDALVQGRPGVLLTLSSQYGANTLEATRRVEDALQALQPLLQREGVRLIAPLHRPATFIQAALRSMRHALWLGALFVVVVLALFLRDWRSAAISFVTIPLSLLAAAAVVRAWGWTINTMTLGGLAVALGVVVDDAIIDVENILRRLHEARRLGVRASVADLILGASLEVRRPIVLATVVVGLVFVPILALPGLQGRFFAPLAAAFLLATFASLLVALTLAPALCLMLLARAPARADTRWQRRLKIGQRRSLRALAPFAPALLGASLLAGVAAVAALLSFRTELLPEFREGHFVVQLRAAPGTSLQAMRRIGSGLSRRVLALPGVATVSMQAGRASLGEDTWAPDRAELHVELKPGQAGADETRIEQGLHQVLADYPGLQSEVLTFLGDRLSESISGEVAPVAVAVFGPDLDQLDVWSARVAALLATLPGARDVRRDAGGRTPTLRIHADPTRLAAAGLRLGEVADLVATAFAGTLANPVYRDGHAEDVRVQLGDAVRTPPEQVGDLPMRAADGRRIALRDVATVDLVDARAVVSHDCTRRRQVITASPRAADVAAFVEAAKAAVRDRLSLPPGLYVEFAGAAEEAAAARAALRDHAALAGLAVCVLLFFAFAGWRSVALILANVPFALLGGVLAVAATGATLSMGSLVGFVALFGISARNSIMLLSHYEHLVQAEGCGWNAAVAWRGARERLTPILMTALVTALALVPLAWGNGEAGREIEGPMAIVILGGLASSTLLNLFLLPVLAARFLDEASLRARAPRSELVLTDR